MMDWSKCLEKNVRERTPNPSEARSLKKMASIRMEDNDRRERTEENISLIVETYWEINRQLITGLLNLKGFKSYSQDCLIIFLEEFYNLKKNELELLDQLRRLRNDIDYRGEFLDREYLDRNEENIKQITEKLEDCLDSLLDDQG